MSSSKMGPQQPWWCIRMVWLAFGGPALVVAACFVTLFFAIHGADRPLTQTRATQTRAAPADASDADTPAQQARNHVVTPQR